ncbi:ABC transporter substrate-binding protein [Couchioplanes azureus]|uniref:ABC transporter substrate-binding protein n=1 Tax=Couchioplanes caeruleus TaxID=56438 RepID=UPI00166FCAC6|nr:ABC transporter substrate-binding protein [Couchioplanes caeruleus]GGQ48536.1 alpha-glucoside ABC transporter substrate-binding protein [Couchioplanes caeruleus subsp. azureus]
MVGYGGRRRRRALAGVLATALLAAGCGGGAAEEESFAESAQCQPYRDYQGNSGTTVSVFSSIRDVEGVHLEQAWRLFSDCTGIKVAYAASGDFEKEFQARVAGGDAPDIAFLPQPGMIPKLAADGAAKPASAATKQLASQNWSADWLAYGTVKDTFYAAPLGANVKSFVWYSPTTFEKKGYAVPDTWDDLIALSKKIAADGVKPWCAGIESGGATGWTATDWLEDVMLRTQGPEVYDKWVSHDLPFNDPAVVDALDKAGSILKNPRFVNGGFGGVTSVASTPFQTAGLPVLQGRCALHRQASFYATQWPSGTKVAEDGDVYAFYFPAVDPAKGKPVLVGGEFAVAFADRPEVQAFQTFLASAEFATARVRLGSWVSANRGVDLGAYAGAIDRLSAEILQDPKAVARFDASDLMPGAVGAGSFWTGMTDWIKGKDTRDTLDAIEASWKD